MKCGCNSLNCEHSLVNLRRKSQGGYKAMTHLHLHTFHSILDGCGSVDNYIKRAKEFNHPAIAITDHGTVSGTFEMYQKCKEAGIKPIIGMEAYLNDNMDTGDDRDYERKNNHQLILVKDQEGYVNLNKLVYRSYNEGFYYKGRIKTDWLLEHKKGLIITTSCMASKISRLVLEGKENQAEEYIKLLLREFGDDLYAELQLNEVPEQKVYNAFIIKMSSKYNIPPIMTGDVHYASPDDNLLQDTMIAINQHKPLGEAFKLSARHLYYTSDRDFFEFNDKFGFNYDSKFVDLCLENTLRVADKCNFEFEVGKEKFPVYEPTPDVSSYFKTQDTREIITKLAHAKLKQKLKKYNESGLIQIDEEKFKKYADRLNYELKVISDKKMLDYFLVYWEIIRDYREKGYDVGPARGCFLPGTPVLMDTGRVKKIEDIKFEECVLDSQASSQKVRDVLVYDIDEEVVELSFSDGTIISCTKDHKFLDNDLEWVEADKIQLKNQCLKSYSASKHYYDILITSYKRDVFLTSKRYFNYKGPVYDLTVNGTSSYNVNGIIVHNSAAGSLLSWCLDITKIDPVRFELYFERFLNPERNSSPDIDVDFEAGTDHIVDEFLYRKYGKERVLSVATFSTFNEKGCLKDVARAHGLDAGFESDVFAVTKEMPNFDKVDYDLKRWFEEWPSNPSCSPRVKNWLTDPRNKKILEQTLKLQGQIRGIGQHAAGIVITPSESWNYLPTNIIAANKSIVTAYQEADKSGKDLSALGILKLDRLKLETLNVIKEAIQNIKNTRGIDIKDKIDYIDLKDPNLFQELRLGFNHGIFQFESPGMNALIKGIRVESFEELVAANALYRPGPMGIGAHEEYIKNKFHPNEIQYVHKSLEPILKETNGVMIYQEQLMFLADSVGRMGLGNGDILRRYMDKASSIIAKASKGEELTEKEKENKDYKAFQKYWDMFLEGAEKQGYSKEEIDKVKDWIIKYLGYSFNKSHSLSYAYLAMQTLYLKHYYPVEFYTALLNHPKTSGGKEKEQDWLAAAISSALSKGIKILPPSRKSGWNWTQTGEREISMGLSAINGLGEIAYAELVDMLKFKGKSFEEIERNDFFQLPFSKYNKKAFESCVKAGVFDEWSTSREELYDMWEKRASNKSKVAANQMTMFDLAQFYAPKLDINKYIPTPEETKISDFVEVCNFNLKNIEKATKIKEQIIEKSGGKISESVTNFDGDGYYYFVLEDFTLTYSVKGKKYYNLKIGNGVSTITMRMFEPMASGVEGEFEKGGIYVAYFEKRGDFINFKNKKFFKKLKANG